jgi:hypothetical protein
MAGFVTRFLDIPHIFDSKIADNFIFGRLVRDGLQMIVAEGIEPTLIKALMP